MRSVVVTGTSSGIGRATAGTLVGQGFRVFGTVRRAEDGEAVRAEIGEGYVPILMDVTDEASVRAGAAEVAVALGNERLAGLVNNAVIQTVDALAVQPIEDVRRTLDVGVLGGLRTVQAFLPLLGADEGRDGPKGRIVNISSIAGSVGFPFYGAYCAAKHAVEGMSESMRREFRHVGVDVIVVAPGNTKSGVFEKVRADVHAHVKGTVWEKPLEDFRKLFLDGAVNGWPMSRVVDAIVTALTASRPKARYVPSAERLMNYTAPQLLPKRLVDWVLDKRIALRAGKPESAPQEPVA